MGVQRISVREAEGSKLLQGVWRRRQNEDVPSSSQTDTAGRVTGILIGAAGLKEFVPGTSFPSISLEDLAAFRGHSIFLHLSCLPISPLLLCSGSCLCFSSGPGRDPARAGLDEMEGLGSWERLVSECSHWARHFSQVPQELSLIQTELTPGIRLA